MELDIYLAVSIANIIIGVILLMLWLTRPPKKGKGSIDETEYRD